MQARRKTCLASDDSVIAAYFKAHTDVAVKKGDVFVVTTTVGNSTYEKSAGDLAPLGAAAVDIATDSEVSEMLSEVFSTDNA